MTHYFMIIPLSKHSTTLGIICLCTSNGIAINNQKFQLCMKTVTFPGLNITPSGITPYSNMLPAIRDFTVPQNIIGAQSWFGLVNQVAWAHSISKMMQPSWEIIKPDSKFLWTAELDKLFNDTKALRVRIIASHFANCKVNSYYCDRNVSHSMKNAKQFFRFKINLIKRYKEWMVFLL